jgi:hypothetical protein
MIFNQLQINFRNCAMMNVLKMEEAKRWNKLDNQVAAAMETPRTIGPITLRLYNENPTLAVRFSWCLHFS